VAQWPWAIEEDIGVVPIAFLHYALDETGRGFADPGPVPDPAALDRLFAPRHARLVFYGHQHYPCPVLPEITGPARYINPGALGCSPEPLARYVLLDVDHNGACRLAFWAAPYDPGPLFAAFEEREVPERAFITATFFGGRGRRMAVRFADMP
jgi:hypothetical protein